ncbi:MAG: sigma-70 family RNA polymerase sigma factor, partial [candidate division WOR-3 bacterium]
SLDDPVDEGADFSREIADESRTPEGDLRRKELRDAIQAAVDALPAEYRSVIVLRDLEGLSNSEVGEALRLSVPAVKSRLHRGRMLLRERLLKLREEMTIA